MHKVLLTASAVAMFAMVPSLASAQIYAADVYPAPGAVVVNPPAVVQAPMAERRVYLAPGTTYVAPGTTYVQPGTEFEDAPIIIDGRRYYRDCWWDWGRRRCELRPWW
jgi:hypothetical protein